MLFFVDCLSVKTHLCQRSLQNLLRLKPFSSQELYPKLVYVDVYKCSSADSCTSVYKVFFFFLRNYSYYVFTLWSFIFFGFFENRKRKARPTTDPTGNAALRISSQKINNHKLLYLKTPSKYEVANWVIWLWLRYNFSFHRLRRCPFLPYLQYPTEPWRSVSMSLPSERDRNKSPEQHSGLNKRLLKALVSMRKNRKDAKLHKYFHENWKVISTEAESKNYGKPACTLSSKSVF